MHVTWWVRLSSKNVAATDRAAEAADDKAASAALAMDANQDDMGETIVYMQPIKFFWSGTLNSLNAQKQQRRRRAAILSSARASEYSFNQ